MEGLEVKKRKKKEDVCTYVEPEFVKMLDAQAAKYGLSRSSMIRVLVLKALKRLKEANYDLGRM